MIWLRAVHARDIARLAGALNIHILHVALLEAVSLSLNRRERLQNPAFGACRAIKWMLIYAGSAGEIACAAIFYQRGIALLRRPTVFCTQSLASAQAISK